MELTFLRLNLLLVDTESIDGRWRKNGSYKIVKTPELLAPGRCKIYGSCWIEKNQWLPLDGIYSMAPVGRDSMAFIGWCKIHGSFRMVEIHVSYWLVQNPWLLLAGKKINGSHWMVKIPWFLLVQNSKHSLVGAKSIVPIGWCRINSSYWLVQNPWLLLDGGE